MVIEMNTPRKTYAVEDAITGDVIASDTNATLARETGEMIAEFNPLGQYVLTEHTLH